MYAYTMTWQRVCRVKTGERRHHFWLDFANTKKKKEKIDRENLGKEGEERNEERKKKRERERMVHKTERKEKERKIEENRHVFTRHHAVTSPYTKTR